MIASAATPNIQGLLDVSAARKLHIGGKTRKPGWQNLDVRPDEHVDVVGDLRSLDHVADQSYDVIYASHVLEHFAYRTELPQVLATLRRLLARPGKLLVSVPDLDGLCRLFLDPTLAGRDRFHIMRIMFGGQMHEFDFHYVGLNWDFLRDYLHHAGFTRAYRLSELRIFDDSSGMSINNVPISLNVVALVD